MSALNMVRLIIEGLEQSQEKTVGPSILLFICRRAGENKPVRREGNGYVEELRILWADSRKKIYMSTEGHRRYPKGIAEKIAYRAGCPA